MKYFSLDLTALSPLAIRADHAPGGVNNAPYIAGTTLVGSLAAIHRMYDSTQTANFEQLFLTEQVQYPNLYPAKFKQEETQNAVTLPVSPVYPVPKTAQTCKRFAGFRVRGDAHNEHHGVRDSLFDWALFALGGQTSDSLTQLLEHKACLICNKAMKHFGGYYCRQNQNLAGQTMAEMKVNTRLQTHTGINRDTGTVQDGILYNREVFEEQARFMGIVKLPDELAKLFENFVSQVGETGLVRVGTGRTRGLGKVCLKTAALPDEQFGLVSFKQRLECFDQKLRTLTNQSESEFYFTLTLHSPAILRDPLLRYRGSIDEETLHELTELPTDSLKRIYQAASVQPVTGWNELWGTPRVQEYAIETGSVFLFIFKARPDEALYKTLFQLEETGIGQRRAEGFGRVCISDPFHLEVTLL